MRGDTIVQELDFSGFDKLDVSDAFAVEIRQGDEFRVTIEVDEQSQRYLEVNQQGDTLQIGMRPRPIAFFWFFNSVHRATITMPSLVGLTIGDATHVTVNGFRTEAEARFEVTDASTLNGEIYTGKTWLIADDASKITLTGDRADMNIDVNDSSHVTLKGNGENVVIRAGNASHVNLDEFVVQDANIIVHDASSVTVDVAGRLDAEADDASSVVYYGNPTLGNTQSTDASSITARQR